MACMTACGIQKPLLSIQALPSLGKFCKLEQEKFSTASRLATRDGSRILLHSGVAQQRNDGSIDNIALTTLASLLQKLLADVCHGSPEDSLRDGQWVKLICGASFEDVAEVRNLSLVYTLAGVDCIDCAANSAIVAAVGEGISAAKRVVDHLEIDLGRCFRKPWIMVSINDDEDPHFRKAEFDARFCPPNCSRPCERVCPASAIHFTAGGTVSTLPYKKSTYGDANLDTSPLVGGVITERCYGCGRCIPVCPIHNIGAKNYVRSMEAVIELLCGGEVQAVEIHTGAGHLEAFESLWKRLQTALQSLKLIAVSLPDLGECMTSSLSSMYAIMQPSLGCLNLWQLDGRPMSGDIGKGATMAAVSLAARVASSSDCPPGYLQLAGGTNVYTLAALEKAGLLKSLNERDEIHKTEALVAGIAFGGYARKIVHDCFSTLESLQETDSVLFGITSKQLESYPSLLLEAVRQAASLVSPIKGLKIGNRGQIRCTPKI